MKFLVTGSAGFIGYHLTKQLITDGHQVIGVDVLNDYYDPRLKEKRNELLRCHSREGGNPISLGRPNAQYGLDPRRALGDDEKYVFHRLDLADKDAVGALIAAEKPDQIIHLAAQAGVRYSLVNPWAYEQSNVLGTLNILEAARHNNTKRVIFASSSSVYGANTKIPFAETDMTDSPVSLYAATKKSCEAIAYTYHHLYGTEIAGLRFFTVYGEYYRPDMALFKFAKNILTGKEIAVYNNGDMKRDFTHVTDIVDGIKAVINKEKLGYEIYNLGSDHPVALEDVISLLEKSLNKKAIKKYMPMQPGDVKITYANIDKARAELNFNPQMTIERGIEEFGQWFTANQDWLLTLADAK